MSRYLLLSKHVGAAFATFERECWWYVHEGEMHFRLQEEKEYRC